MPMMNLEWAHVIIGGASAIVGAAGGLAAGVWRVAHIEQDIRKDLSQDIAEATHELGEKLSSMASHFDETLRGLRQKINDVELDAARGFVAKSEFADFRDEYREDMRDLKRNVSVILSKSAST
jgi:hypothetical protein